jgi:hypothetical protein
MELSMDEKDFREIDRHIAKELQAIQRMPIKPLEYEWIPIGEYNGVDLSGIMIDENYIVWQQVLNSEYNCEVILQ